MAPHSHRRRSHHRSSRALGRAVVARTVVGVTTCLTFVAVAASPVAATAGAPGRVGSVSSTEHAGADSASVSWTTTPRGSVPASAPVRDELTGAIKHSELTAAVDPGNYSVADIRLSRSHPNWAAAVIRPAVPLAGATVLAHRVDGRWKVITLGTAFVGCGEVPQPVLQDFTGYSGIDRCH